MVLELFNQIAPKKQIQKKGKLFPQNKNCLPKDLRFSMDVDIKGEVFCSIKVIKYKLKVVMKGRKEKRGRGKGKEKKLIYRENTKKKKKKERKKWNCISESAL